MAPLTALTSTLRPFKVLFTFAPVLSHPDPSCQFTVEVDASYTGFDAVLSQRNAADQKLNHCTFFSRCLSLVEHNYEVGNCELLALVLVLKEWCHWLEGTAKPSVVWNNHKNLEYLRGARYVWLFFALPPRRRGSFNRQTPAPVYSPGQRV